MALIENFFRNKGLSINPLKEGLSPLAGPRLRRYSHSFTSVTIDPSKHRLTVEHNGNMGNTDADVVKNVQQLVQRLKAANNTDGGFIESIFRKIKPVLVDGSPDYSYTEIYKIPKTGTVVPPVGESAVNELVDIEDPSSKAKVSSGGITTIGHVDDKSKSATADLEKSLIDVGFEQQRTLDGKMFVRHTTGSVVKIKGNFAEVKTNGKKYNVDMTKFKPSDIIKLVGSSTVSAI